MNESPHEQEARQRRRRIKAIIVISPFVLLLAGRFWLHVAEQSAISRIRDGGEPVTIDELNAWYFADADEPNAAPIYQRAFNAIVLDDALIEPVPGFTRANDLPPRGVGLTEQQIEAGRALLEANRRAMALLDEAAAVGHCRFPLDFSQGIGLDQPHLGQLRQAARLYQLQAFIAARDGRMDDATQAIERVFSLADTVRDEPVVISLLVHVSLDQLAIETIERLMCEHELSDAQLAALDRAIASRDIGNALANALISERCIVLAHPEMPWGHPAVRAVGMFIPDKLAYLRAFEDVINQAQRHFEAGSGDWRIVEPVIPDYAIIANMVQSPLKSCGVVLTHHIAMHRCARAAIAAERHKLAHGTLPASLDELAPQYLDAVPLDPFVGRPLHYAPRDGGAAVWSVGEDETDNQGVERSAANQWMRENTDIAFTIDLPEPATPQAETSS